MTRVSHVNALACLLAVVGCNNAPTADPGRVQPNDNTHPAGTLSSGVLNVALETRIGSWMPEGDGGKSIDSVIAFAETGHPATTPGPLLRVPVGTRVHGTIHNTLARPLTVKGLGATRAPTDTLVVPAGATTPFEFTADQPGTFLYEARTHTDTLYDRDPREMQLQGVLVVDRPNAPPDRIIGNLVVLHDRAELEDRIAGPASMVINGLSWPHTERLTYAGRFGSLARRQLHRSRSSDAPARLLLPRRRSERWRGRLALHASAAAHGRDRDDSARSRLSS